MIRKLYFYWENSFDPYYNLSLEQHLTTVLPPESCILYLWQNAESVVIGRNQNPWSECAIGLLKEDRVSLVRRFSGGGTVYHDLGNLNYTFVTARSNYNLEKQLSVIIRACEEFGIHAVASGRNDILAEGRKFSGSAFYHSKESSIHHGTILIHSDFTKMTHYLTPSAAKLQAKGISSVRSRVVNLTELCPNLTPQTMASQILHAFEEIYGYPADMLALPLSDRQVIEGNAAKLRSAQWIYKNTPPFNYTMEETFPWGNIQLLLQIDHGDICHIAVYTDSLEHNLSDQLQEALNGCSFNALAMEKAICTSKLSTPIQSDLCHWISQQDI